MVSIANGDLNNTSAERTRTGTTIDPAYRTTSLAIPNAQDDTTMRTTYRPFLLDHTNAEDDWISQLELSTVLKMVDLNVLKRGEDRLKVLVLYGSLRERYVHCDAIPRRKKKKLILPVPAQIILPPPSLRSKPHPAPPRLRRARLQPQWPPRQGLCKTFPLDPHASPQHLTSAYQDDVQHSHPKVQELRDLSKWSDGHIWVSPEQHGNLTAVFKNQIDWIPLSTGSVRPTQGRTLAIAQVSGGSQSFNTVNSLRVLGRWMRMFAIPNQSSVPMAYTQFTDAEEGGGGSRMKPSGNRDRLVDCMEEFVKYTVVMREHFELFGDRFSERTVK
ncbi:hypothetical protein IAQ61_011790 [Plenodomus lingam]|uniref:uncharacterized protein n=1 Tax=Leptosphaeria maculans TaxID=5022 RepID=UPI00332F8CBD|nr:hypothetical protein IAQ61_011790 [Plenodomus lingam]